MNSVNTNVGAMVALQNLNVTSNQLGTVQNRINTGLKVGSAKDNGAIWAIAQNSRSDIAALDSVKDSIQRGQSTVDVAKESANLTALQTKQQLGIQALSIANQSSSIMLSLFR